MDDKNLKPSLTNLTPRPIVVSEEETPAPPPSLSSEKSLPPLPSVPFSQPPLPKPLAEPPKNDTRPSFGENSILPPVVTPPTPKSKTKIIAAIVAVIILLAAIPAGVVLVSKSQETREKASSMDPCNVCNQGVCEGVAQIPACSHSEDECSSDSDCAAPEPTATPTPDQATQECTPRSVEKRCADANSCAIEQKTCSTDGTWGGWQSAGTDCRSCDRLSEPTPTPTPGSGGGGGGAAGCNPRVQFSGATQPSFDCSQRNSVNISMTVSVPTGCDRQLLSWNETTADCSGSSFAGCAGSCSNTPHLRTTSMAEGESNTFSLSCNAPTCGSCQVDFSNFNFNAGVTNYGVRGYQNTSCSTTGGGTGASCQSLKVYKYPFNAGDLLTAPLDRKLKPNETARLCVAAPDNATTGEVKINTANWESAPMKRSMGGSTEFCKDYVIPYDATSLRFQGRVR